MDDMLIGMAGLEDIQWPHGAGWLSLALAKPWWGRGLGTEAMRLLLGYAFCELNLYRVQLTVFSYNARALALYRRAGFQQEGVFREFLSRDGVRYDILLMGLVRREWEELQRRPAVRDGSKGGR